MRTEEFIQYFNEQYKDTEYHEQEFEAILCSDSDPTDPDIRIYDNHNGSTYGIIRASDIPEVLRRIARGKEPLYATCGFSDERFGSAKYVQPEPISGSDGEDISMEEVLGPGTRKRTHSK